MRRADCRGTWRERASQSPLVSGTTGLTKPVRLFRPAEYSKRRGRFKSPPYRSFTYGTPPALGGTALPKKPASRTMVRM